jgi:hypothetical protein
MEMKNQDLVTRYSMMKKYYENQVYIGGIEYRGKHISYDRSGEAATLIMKRALK